MLLRTKDLDVYTNVARNEHLPLDAPTIKSMCSIAGPAVEREEQALWVPSLKLMHEPSSLSTSSDEEREQRLWIVPTSRSYVCRCLNAIPTRSLRMTFANGSMIQTYQCPCNCHPNAPPEPAAVRDVATSEANAALRGDKLSHLAARILEGLGSGRSSYASTASFHGGGDGRSPKRCQSLFRRGIARSHADS